VPGSVLHPRHFFWIADGVLITGQVGCLEDIQDWHIELFHDFHLLVVEVLYTGICGIAQFRNAKLKFLTTTKYPVLYVL
jgi:hypothetical protein